MSSDSQNYNRRKGEDNYKGDKKSIVQNEVKKLFRDNTQNISQSAMYKLREKYGDEELLDQIQDAFMEKSREIRKRAKKFARMITERYQNSNYPLHILLKKALKYKVKYNLSDSEFEEFRRIYEQTLTGTERPQRLNVTVPFTSMSRALGQGNVDANDGMKFDDKDYSLIHDIMRLYSEKKPTHAQVVLQSIVYKDTAYEALTGKFSYERNNPHCHIHPVIAALFLPKIEILENNMLRSNIAYIVKTRYTKQPILTSTDYQLFYDLISDPTDVVCSSDSAVKDLAGRANLQCQIWDSVLSLRNGRYYDCNSTNFLVAVDQCKRNTNDSPDLLYENDEGTMMQRILGSFSLRPTIVATTPLYGMVSNNPMRAHTHIPKVQSLPMVVLRLPVLASISNSNVYNNSVHLKDSLDDSQWYVENGNVVPRNQQIIYSRGVLIFYVPRRAHTLNIGNLVEPYNFTRLPSTVAGFERLNDREVQFDFDVSLKEHQYTLRSVVCVEINSDMALKNGPKLVTGSSTLIVKQDEDGISSRYFHYNPRNAAIGFKDIKTNEYRQDDPIVTIPIYDTNDGLETFDNMAQQRGTIFVYQQVNDSKPESIYPF